MIKEIWGNGEDIIIKYTQSSIAGESIWYAASKWMSVSYPYTDKFLKDCGYRKLNIKEFLL